MLRFGPGVYSRLIVPNPRWCTPLLFSYSYSLFPLFGISRRIERVIHGHDTRAALQFIRALQARVPVQDQQGVKAWLGHQVTAVLSSITKPPSVGDVEMFVGIAESEGLLFFSQTYVLVDARNASLA